MYFLRLPDIRTTFPQDQRSHQSGVHPQGSTPRPLAQVVGQVDECRGLFDAEGNGPLDREGHHFVGSTAHHAQVRLTHLLVSSYKGSSPNERINVPTLTYSQLRFACSPGGSSALTSVTELAPAGGPHAGVAPSTVRRRQQANVRV